MKQLRSPNDQAVAIFSMLVSRQLTDRYQAIDILSEDVSGIDLQLLRSMIVHAIDNDFSVGRENDEDDWSIRDTRSWLLSALGRILGADDGARDVVLKHLDRKFEEGEWVRYWVLEGLIAGKDKAAREAAEKALLQQDVPLVAMLADAYLASCGEKNAQERVKNALSGEGCWQVYRALRVILLPFAIDTLCKTVEECEFNDVTYDAIVALGNVQHDTPRSRNAAQALSAAVLKLRGKPWQDGMRTAAISALGKLAVDSTSPILLEELFDDNPAVVRQAARSIQQILGLRTTIARVVEVATKLQNPNAVDTLGRALRWLDKEAVANELENIMSAATAEQQDASRALLSELGGVAAFEKLRVRTVATRQFVDVLDRAEERVSTLFEQSIAEARKGFGLATIMDAIVFLVGVLLLLVSAGFALFTDKNLMGWVGVGGTGVASVIYGIFVAKPREKVRQAVDHLMSLKVLFLAYLRRLHQSDQSFTRLLLDNDEISIEQLNNYNELVGKAMEQTLIELDKRQKQ